MNNPILSSLVQELTISGVTFFVRGMTVSEVLHLNIRVGAAGVIGQVEFLTIGQECLVGWRDLRFERDGEMMELGFSKENIHQIPARILIRIGEFAYNNLTLLTEAESDKLRGYIRFSTYLSDEKNKAQEKTYDCVTCIKNGLHEKRSCGLVNKQEMIERILGKPEEKKVVERKKSAAEIMSPYTVFRSRAAPKTQAPPPVEEVKPVVELEKPVFKIPSVNFSFPECPVSWVPVSLKMLANLLYSAGKSNMPFYQGGVGDQPYKTHSAQQVVLSESARIEMEKMEQDRKKNSKPGSSKGRR